MLCLSRYLLISKSQTVRRLSEKNNVLTQMLALAVEKGPMHHMKLSRDLCPQAAFAASVTTLQLHVSFHSLRVEGNFWKVTVGVTSIVIPGLSVCQGL